MKNIRPKGIARMIYRKEISLDQRWSQGYTVQKNNIRKYTRLMICAKVKLKTMKTSLCCLMHAALTHELICFYQFLAANKTAKQYKMA